MYCISCESRVIFLRISCSLLRVLLDGGYLCFRVIEDHLIAISPSPRGGSPIPRSFADREARPTDDRYLDLSVYSRSSRSSRNAFVTREDFRARRSERRRKKGKRTIRCGYALCRGTAVPRRGGLERKDFCPLSRERRAENGDGRDGGQGDAHGKSEVEGPRSHLIWTADNW